MGKRWRLPPARLLSFGAFSAPWAGAMDCSRKTGRAAPASATFLGEEGYWTANGVESGMQGPLIDPRQTRRTLWMSAIYVFHRIEKDYYLLKLNRGEQQCPACVIRSSRRSVCRLRAHVDKVYELCGVRTCPSGQ